MSKGKRQRVLISALACSPVRGSEAAVGWNICTRLGESYDVVVLYASWDGSASYQREIEAYIAESGPVPGVTFVPIRRGLLDRFYLWLHERGPLIAYYWAYRRWQFEAFRVARELHSEKPFALAHHLTVNGFREPGYLWRLPVPFVWGPVGGLMFFPWSYRKVLDTREEIGYAFRNVCTYLQMRFSRRVLAAGRKASVLFTVTSAERALAMKHWCVPACQLGETGTSPSDPVSRPEGQRNIIHLGWSGLHKGRKALPLLLYALTHLPETVSFRLTVLGAGPATAAWKALAAKLGLTERIDWPGLLPRDQALARMREADCLVFTSLMEGTPHVVVEALSSGLPVITHDCCGMGEVVDATCGITIPIKDINSSVCGFAAAIEKLARDLSLRQSLARGALIRSRELTWDSKVEAIAAAYESIVGTSSEGGTGAQPDMPLRTAG